MPPGALCPLWSGPGCCLVRLKGDFGDCPGLPGTERLLGWGGLKGAETGPVLGKPGCWVALPVAPLGVPFSVELGSEALGTGFHSYLGPLAKVTK